MQLILSNQSALFNHSVGSYAKIRLWHWLLEKMRLFQKKIVNSGSKKRIWFRLKRLRPLYLPPLQLPTSLSLYLRTYLPLSLPTYRGMSREIKRRSVRNKMRQRSRCLPLKTHKLRKRKDAVYTHTLRIVKRLPASTSNEKAATIWKV